jgi:hypothetical protein
MSQKKTSKSLDDLISKINELHGAGWQAFDNELASLCEVVKEEDLKEICLNLDTYNMAFSSSSGRGWNRGKWMADRFLSQMLPAYVELGDKILKESEIDSVKCLVITSGIYTDIAMIDEVAENGTGDSQALAATFCSIDTLRKLKGHKNKKVRKIYYNRLGPVECLDEMLDDKIADIRYEGLARAPYYYEKLKGFTKEIARGPFTLLIEKIPLEYLPMLVANRNVKNSWISRKFERRISAGR